MAVSHVKSNPVANMTGTVTVFNSAGITATAAATDLVRPVDWNSAHNQFMTISGNIGANSTASGSNIVFQAAGNISLFASTDTIIFSAPVQTVQTQNMVSVQGSTGAIVFNNANGVTFGANASTITASHNGITQQSTQPVAVSGQNGSYAFSTLSLSNANGISFGTSAGSAITASHNALTSQSNQAVSAANGSSAFQTLSFANGNGVSFATAAGGLGASVETSYAASNHSHGNPTLALTNLSGTTASNSAGLTLSLSAAAPGGGAAFSAGLSGGNTSGDTGTVSNQIVFAGGNNITVSGSTNAGGMSVTISGANAGGAQTGISGIVVSNTTYTSGTVSFSNANGISFGSSAGQAITASYTVPTITNSSWTVSDNGTSGTVGRLAFTNLNGVTLSLSTGAGGSHTIVGSHNALTSQSNQAFSADASSTFQTLSFQNSNGVSFSNNAGALRVTHDLQFTSATSAITSNALHSSASRVINIVAATNNTGGGTASLSSNVSFSAANGITFYTSAGGAVVASHNGLTTARASNDAIGLNTAQTNVTWTVNSSGISINAAGYAGTATTFNGTNVSGSMTLNSAGLRLDLSAGAGGGVNPAASASNGSFAFTTLNFSNANNVTFGTSVGGIITASVAAPGAAAEQNAINLLGANTAGNTTATGSTIGMSGVNLTLSGTNTSQIVISAPATSSLVGASGISLSTNGSTVSIYQSPALGLAPYDDLMQVVGQNGQGSLYFDPQPMPGFAFDRVVHKIQNTNSSNSSGSHTLSFWVGLYTRNSNSLSRYWSGSGSTAVTHSGTAGSYSLYSGARILPLTVNATTIDPGRYWIGFVSRTTSGGANGTYSNYVVSNIASNMTGVFGQAANATAQPRLGQGIYSATTSGMPASVAFSEIQGTGSVAMRMPILGFGYSTY